MADKFIVGISDLKVVTRPDTLVTYALGSCVGICLYDELTGVAGMSHILLPESSSFPTDDNKHKFADTAIIELIKKMQKKGATKRRLVAKIAGGAQLFAHNTANLTMRIGERNVISVKEQLKLHGLRILAEDTGKDYGRTVEFSSIDGSLIVSSALKGEKRI